MKIFRFAVDIIVFLLLYAAILAGILLLSAGILAIGVGVTVLGGLFTAVASDLSPPALILAGISCISAGLAVSLGVIIAFPACLTLRRKENP
jgi:hypothetical protein